MFGSSQRLWLWGILQSSSNWWTCVSWYPEAYLWLTRIQNGFNNARSNCFLIEPAGFTCKCPFHILKSYRRMLAIQSLPSPGCPLNSASGYCQNSEHSIYPQYATYTALLAATPWWIETCCCFSEPGNISIEMSGRHETVADYPRSDDWHHLYSINIEEGKVIPNLIALLLLIRIQYSITGLLMNVSI